MCLQCAAATMRLLAVGFSAAAASPEATPDQAALLTNVEHAMSSFYARTTDDEDSDASADKLIDDLSVLSADELRDVGVTMHFAAFATRALADTILAVLKLRAENGDAAAQRIITKDTRAATEVQVHVINMDEIMQRARDAQEPQVPGRGKQPPMMS